MVLSLFFFFFWRTIELRISPYTNVRNCDEEFVAAPINSNFHNKTFCESGDMRITRFVTYLSIAFHIYLLTYYYSFLAHYNKKCFNVNWFHLLSPTILSLWYSHFEVTWLLRDDSNSKTRVLKIPRKLNENPWTGMKCWG